MARRNDKKSSVIPKPLKILYVEDSPADAELCLHDLKKAGLAPQADVVASSTEFHLNLKTKPYDVILSDSSMPEFSAMEALEIARREAPDIPFILVTGTIGDESAVECIKKGATDYVLKDRRARLAESVRRALEEKRLREEREHAQEDLKRERQRLFNVLETMPVAICLLTADYHVAFANRSFCGLFGDPKGRHCYESVFGLSAPCEFCQSFEPLKTGQPHQWEVTSPEGRVFDVHDFPFTDSDGSSMILEMDIDITDRKKAEAELRAARDQWELTFDTVPDPILVMDKDCRITRANRAAAALAGLGPQQVIGKPCYEIVHGQREPRADCPHQRLLQSLAPAEADIYEPWLDKYFTSSVIPLSSQDGGQGGCVHVLHDVTARRQAEDDLRHSEELFHVFMNHSPALAWMKDREGRYVYCNQTFLNAMNLTEREVIGQTDRDLWPVEIAERFQANDLKVLDAATPMEFVEPVPGPDADREVWVFKFPFHDPLGRQLVGAKGIEITERKRLEMQLRQAQKMEAIGQLAGGVAHDFNNLLTIISGYSELLGEALSAHPRWAGHVKQIQDAAVRASALTKQLLAFARRQTVTLEVMDINAAVTGAEQMLRRLIGEDIELVTKTSAGLWHVKADPSQVEQVILNLVVNARDAMPQGGRLIVETANLDARPGDIPCGRGLKPGRYVVLRITDNGLGIDPKIRDHIFEPFFTTKEKGKGTGLGLATVYGIATQNGGHVYVDSELGVGTTFQVFLPSIEEAIAGPSPETQPTVHRPCTETVLVVEDEESLRTMVRSILETCGYKVLEASQGADALALVEHHTGPIHLLLTDVVMPQMGGPELAGKLSSLVREIKVLYMSGYTDGRITFDASQAHYALITKPFTPRRLMDKVRDVLDSQRYITQAA